MKRGLWGVLLIIVASTAMAGRWEPYVGVLGKVGSPITFYGMDLPHKSLWLPIPFSAGLQYELGLKQDKVYFYFTYSYLNSVSFENQTASHFSEGTVVTRENYGWGERRALLGARIHSEGTSLFQGVIGGALSLGRSVYRHEYQEYYYLDSFPPGMGSKWLHNTEQHRQSKISLGFMIELGVLFELTHSLNCMVVGQFHRFESSFGSDPNYYTVDRAVVFSPELCLALTYSFKRLSL